MTAFATPSSPKSGAPTASDGGFTALLIDDDAGFSSLIEKLVREAGGRPKVCASLAEARTVLERETFDCVVLDNRLPDGTGYEFFPYLSQRCPSSVVVMITGAPELAQAVELTRNGLLDYLTKPVDADAFQGCLERVKKRLKQGNAPDSVETFVGRSGAMHEVVQSLQQAARHPETTVLLLGETGTGKDLAARLLHQWTNASRSRMPEYVAVNCGSIPAEMFEAELFGSEKGAYTGADRRRVGLVEAAEDGTLFLDEVAEIPLALQVKLLRFLESREYRLLGSSTTRTFRGRVVAATNRLLDEEVRQGRLREDLRFRLDVFSVVLPPLRERPEDLEPLAEHLLSQLSQKYHRKQPQLKPYDLEVLKGYAFPGNVRELRNLLERSLLKTAEEALVMSLDLGWLSGLARTQNKTPLPRTGEGESRDLSVIDRQEYELIRQALQEESGGIRRAAARLGLTHQALLRRLQKWPELRQPSSSSQS